MPQPLPTNELQPNMSAQPPQIYDRNQAWRGNRFLPTNCKQAGWHNCLQSMNRNQGGRRNCLQSINRKKAWRHNRLLTNEPQPSMPGQPPPIYEPQPNIPTQPLPTDDPPTRKYSAAETVAILSFLRR